MVYQTFTVPGLFARRSFLHRITRSGVTTLGYLCYENNLRK